MPLITNGREFGEQLRVPCGPRRKHGEPQVGEKNREDPSNCGQTGEGLRVRGTVVRETSILETGVTIQTLAGAVGISTAVNRAAIGADIAMAHGVTDPTRLTVADVLR